MSEINFLEKQLEFVHFQITKKCNLRCVFCGQWGEKGFFKKERGCQVSFEEWLDVAKQLRLRDLKPKLMLWGGEPLVCPFFDRLAEALFEMGFNLQLITNGTLLEQHRETINRCFERIYVSIDGLEEQHDRIRGAGVFARVIHNLKCISPEKVVINTVISKGLNINAFAKFFGSYQILLQEMIVLNTNEIVQYKKWLMQTFQKDATCIEAWNGEKRDILISDLPSNVTLLRHGNRKTPGWCLSPWRHMHIAWNGEVMYCTDFLDFSAGNIRENSIESIFQNELSERFRQEIKNGACITCEHCSWRGNIHFN